jgi:hypothetical protein
MAVALASTCKGCCIAAIICSLAFMRGWSSPRVPAPSAWSKTVCFVHAVGSSATGCVICASFAASPPLGCFHSRPVLPADLSGS